MVSLFTYLERGLSMEEFPGNSRRARESREDEDHPREKLQPVIEGKITRRKAPMGRRFASVFFGGDARGAVGFVFAEVLLPAAKDAISDAFREGLDRVLYGEERQGPRRPAGRSGRGRSVGHVPYNHYSDRSPMRPRREDPRRAVRGPARNKLDEILFNRRVEAEQVLQGMWEVWEKYGFVTVAHFFELVGEDGDYTDEDYGWTSLEGCKPVHVRDGFILDLPRPEPLR